MTDSAVCCEALSIELRLGSGGAADFGGLGAKTPIGGLGGEAPRKIFSILW